MLEPVNLQTISGALLRIIASREKNFSQISDITRVERRQRSERIGKCPMVCRRRILNAKNKFAEKDF